MLVYIAENVVEKTIGASNRLIYFEEGQLISFLETIM